MDSKELFSIRAGLGLSQAQLAKKLKISERQYIRIEKGYSNVSGPISILMTLAKNKGRVPWR